MARTATRSPSQSSRNRRLFTMLLVPVILLSLVVGLVIISQPKAATTFPTTRDKYKWPFSRYSIWNMPIGSGAQFKPAGMPRYDEFVAETNYNSIDPSAPVKPVNRLDTNGGGVTKSFQGHVSPDVASYIQNTQYISGNKCGAVLNADKNTIIQGQPMDYTNDGVSYYFEWTGDGVVDGWTGQPYTLTGGGAGGCQGGSGLSALGGSIRDGELVGDEPIRHALKLVVFCHTTCSKYENKGYRWPARKADSYWQDGYNPWCPACGDNSYNGSVNDTTMGSLLALKPDEDLSSITDPKARKVAQALKDYGAYIVDDSATTKYHISIDALAIKNDLGGDSFLGSHPAFQQQLIDLMPKLHVVTNNSPTSIGGGGNPLVCLAPPFSNGTDDITTNPNGSVTEPSNCDSTSTPTPTPTASPTPTPTTTPTPNSNADITGDGIVGVLDLAKLISNYNKTNATKDMGDLNNDGSVTLSDLSMLVKAWGT